MYAIERSSPVSLLHQRHEDIVVVLTVQFARTPFRSFSDKAKRTVESDPSAYSCAVGTMRIVFTVELESLLTSRSLHVQVRRPGRYALGMGSPCSRRKDSLSQ